MNRTAALLLCFLVAPIRVPAHHSNAEYDFETVEEIIGEVIEVSWRNPHVSLTLHAGEDDELWALEAQDINSLGRRGLDSSLIHVGDALRVAGHPSTRRPHALFVTNVLLPGGTEIRTRGETEPRWSADHIGFARVDIDDVQAAAPRTTGIFRVWVNRSAAWFEDDALPLRPTARAVHSAWNPADNLNRLCITPGMPAAMRMPSAHPIDFSIRDGDILIRNEMFDIERTIHMQPAGPRIAPTPSPLGHSVGHWAGDTLVVTTNRISWLHFNYTGSIPQSDRVAIVERFRVDENANTLVYDMTVTDPATFTEPVTKRWILDWRPDLVVEPYECVLGELPPIE